MNVVADFLSAKEDRVGFKTLIALVFIAWVFGVVCRLFWIFVFADANEFYWLGQFMINTNDGYYWAEGARDLLEKPDVIDELSPTTRGLPIITAFLAKCLPFISFETLILYMPAFIGSLLAIPVVLIGRALNHTLVGFVAAALSVVAWSYYNRTMIGYYDDDMLVLVLPVFVLYALIAGIRSQKAIYPLLSALFAFASIWYYPNSQLLIFGMAFVLTLYALVARVRAKPSRQERDAAARRSEAYNYKLLIFLALGVIAVRYGLIAFAAIAVVFAAFVKYKEQTDRLSVLLPLVAIALIAALYFSGVISHFWHQFSGYIIRDTTSAINDEVGALHFFNVAQTVREAGEIPFSEFASRISAHTAAFILAVIGTIVLFARFPVLLIALPFVGLGFMAYGIPGYIGGGGLRFTIYAVPVLALGLSYLIFLAANIVENRRMRYALIAALSVLALLPHLAHIYDYRMPTVFYSFEVEALDKLKERIEPRKDYAISWWDYGYPIRYYSYAKTLADGGKHSGSDNFAPSFILTTDNQLAAAKMARLAVEYTEKQIDERNLSRPIMALMLADYNETSPDRFLLNLADVAAPPKSREIYLVLPNRMGEIFGAVSRFSSLDLATGRQFAPPFFMNALVISDQNNIITLTNGVTLDKRTGMAQIGAQKAPIKYFYAIGVDQNGRSFARSQTAHPNGSLSVIANISTGSFWVVDDRALNCVFVQLFALENYDRNLFELVVSSPLMKIYRVLI
ncbi:MAG: peptide transporter [Helicobacteraceae bacterium]|jgi:dolichyl-diphosphooligosaccharide--protein glycosyltransferase/undecaprenyl-diphosphooligosaccharide--protein glycosyltransferase|nr:peptide transporter [Helicobacteraceae bacterium]